VVDADVRDRVAFESPNDVFVSAMKPSPPGQFRAYASRWWVLTLASLMTALQGGFWNMFGPIAPAVQPLLGWSVGTIALLNNWGPILFCITLLPSSWLLDTRGLRPSCLLCMGLVVAGAVCRAITATGRAATPLMHLGQILNAAAGPVSMSVGPLVSATWFPPEQRTTSTSIISVLNYGGCALMFVVGPALVPSRAVALGDDDDGAAATFPDAAARDATAADVLAYQRWCAVLAALVLLAMFCYFPNKPPTPPSLTATTERTDFRGGLRSLRSGKRDYWLCCCAYGIVTGFYGSWGSMLAPNLAHVLPRADAESESGWLGFYGSVAGCVAGMACGVFADRFGSMKRIALGNSLAAAAAFLVFGLYCSGALPMSTGALYASSVLGGLLINSTIPLFFELAVETAYPVAEGLSGGVLALMNNVFCLLFLLVAMVPGLGTAWMNWAVVAAALIGFGLMVPFREDYKRLRVDQEGQEAQGNRAPLLLAEDG
jgi:MFS transporter, FLVCR family, disrupted in renal carcinoma protein 2